MAELKAEPGRLGLESLLAEIAKLERVRLHLPVGLFADLSSTSRSTAWSRTRGATPCSTSTAECSGCRIAVHRRGRAGGSHSNLNATHRLIGFGP